MEQDTLIPRGQPLPERYDDQEVGEFPTPHSVRTKDTEATKPSGYQQVIRKLETTCFLIGPLGIFTLNTATWAMGFHYHPFLLMCLQICYLAILISLTVIFKETYRFVFKLGVMMCATLFASFCAGFFLYYKYSIYYYSYEDLRVYTNVQASQSPNGFQDSGMLEFSRTAHVDITRSVGFESPDYAGRIFCVAPVMEAGMPFDTEIGFWAVGTDCCSKRAHFACGYANDPTANSALIELRDELIAPQALFWVINWFSERPWSEYEKAIKMQNEVFGTKVAKNHILLHWERYPIQVMENIRRAAIEGIVHLCILFFVFNMIMGFFYQKYSRHE